MSDAPTPTCLLIQHARVGDVQAMEVLFKRYREYVRLLVRCQASGRLQSRVDSSDLIQETLLRAALRSDRIERMTQTREQLSAQPLPPMSPEEIQAEIDAYRAESRRALGT